MPPFQPVPQVAESLAALRAHQPGLLDDVVEAERVFWIGSGVSRDQAPPLEKLIRMVINYLQSKMQSEDDADTHFVALRQLTERYFADEYAEFLRNPTGWRPSGEGLLSATNCYSDILATEVAGEADDYLLWDAIDIRETYGSPHIEPGPEHNLIAILIQERLLRAMVTTNWDGLIETASSTAAIGGDGNALAVQMTNESFQTERGYAELNKIHGCAVLARSDPAAYRQYLIARVADIAVWRSESIFSFVIARIESLLQARRSVFLGLSVQDHNLLALIASATTLQPWHWDKKNPTYVFATKELGQRQIDFLNIAYRNEPPERRPEIRECSSLAMYSGPTLASFVVHSLRRKLEVGLDRAVDYNAVSDVMQSLMTGLESLESALLRRVGSKVETLVRILKQGVTPMLYRYFDPTASPVPDSYFPFFPGTVTECASSPQFKNLSLPEFTVTLCLVGLGRAHDLWEPILISDGSAAAGIIVLRSKSSRRRVALVITRDEVATSAFKATELWRDDRGPIVLLQTTGQRAARAVRGLGRGIGSGRAVGSDRRQSWLADMQPALGAPSDLLAAFRAEVAL